MVAKTVFITGTNRGIGLGLVKELLKCPEPPKVLIASYRDPAKSEELLNLAKQHSNLQVIQFDTKIRSSFPEVAKKIEDLLEGKGLNLLINNAGVKHTDSFPNVAYESMMEDYEVNTVCPLLLLQELFPLIKKASEQAKDKPVGVSRAAVINVSTSLGSVALYKETAIIGHCFPYRCSKTAVNLITHATSFEFSKDSILSACLHPGWVATAMGGPDAPMSVEQSCSSIVKTLSSLDSSHQGAFLQFDGTPLPW